MTRLFKDGIQNLTTATETHVSRLRRKLLGSGVAIRTLRGFGYQLALEADNVGRGRST